MPKKGENVRQRKDGLWEGRYPCGVTDDGKKSMLLYTQGVMLK